MIYSYENLKNAIVDKEKQTVYTGFDNALLQVRHYKIHPEMLPYIGIHYLDTQILLVGESHYLGDNEQMNSETSQYQQILENVEKKKKIYEKWYEEEWNHIEDIDVETIKNSANYYYTRRVVIDTFIYGDTLGSGQIFYNPLKIVYGENTSKENINKFAFLNYFQRPEFKGGNTIQNEEKDNEVAGKTLFEVIGILKPKKVIFLSSKAYRAFKKTQWYQSVSADIDCVAHPGCAWWNRKGGKYGKNKFKKIYFEMVKNT